MRRHPRRPRLRRAPIALLTMLVLLVSSLGPVRGATPPPEPPDQGVQRGGAVGPSGMGHRGRVDLREVPRTSPSDQADGSDAAGVRDERDGQDDAALDAAAVAEPVLTTAPPAAITAWTGTGHAQTGQQPAGSWVAVGPDHVLQVVNHAIRIWDRTGASRLPLTQLGSAAFFATPSGHGAADPRVLYDARHGRWVMSQVRWTCDDGTGRALGYVDVMISETADPTQAWHRSYLEWEGFLPDDPAFGTSSDKLAVGSTIRSLAPGPGCAAAAVHAGVDVTVMDWDDILAAEVTGTFSVASFTWSDAGDYTVYAQPRVALQTPATSGTLHVVTHHDRAGTSVVRYTKFTGSVVAGTIRSTYDGDLDTVGVSDPSVEPPAPVQPGGSPVVPDDRIDDHPTDAVYQGGRVAYVATNGCAPGGGSLRACVRVTEFTAGSAGATPTPRQDLLIGAAGVDHSFGGIGYSLDGSLHVVWTRSADAAGGEPSAVTAYQRRSDAPGTLSPSQVVVQGAGAAFTGGRWGPASPVAQDPQVPSAVWQAPAAATGGPGWTTRVAQLQTGGTTYVPITPVRVLDSRIGLGVSGAFRADEPRTFVVGGFTGSGGIPADAVAVTGNLTVTAASGSGYVSITPTATTTPGTSTLNLPAGDTRANNVTVSLARDGRLAAVYKAAAGRTAQVVFDVTGYFVAGSSGARYRPLTPTRLLDSRTGLGVSGSFRSGIPKKLDVVGRGGVPEGATAITANLTVVGQTRSGYVSVTPTSQASPATSTINFPVGDVRANGVTARLSGGDLWLVYRSGSSTATTHLVLDITGYYRPGTDGLIFYPLEPGRIMDTRSTVLSGLSGTFASGTPRRLDVDGHWGVAAGARAITGNLTVTAQTAAGFVTASTSSSATPTTSTINVPTGESRANGVTLPLTSAGDEWFVYRASSGSRTHLILDVTGYFR